VNRRNILIGGGVLAVAGVGAAYLGSRQMGSMEEYSASVAATRAALSHQPEVRDLIRYATLAANGHNTQPWLFRIDERRVEILPDLARRTPAVDPTTIICSRALAAPPRTWRSRLARAGAPAS
jgi:hypothetical protein